MIVSTTASGNVAPYVGSSDITMMYSVTDIAGNLTMKNLHTLGLNRVSRKILGNAAHCIAGMALQRVPEVAVDKPLVGLTMFGVTTPCVEMVTSLILAPTYMHTGK